MGKKSFLFFICVMIIVVVCVYKYNQFMGVEKASTGEELAPVSSIAISEEEANKISNMTPMRLYFLNEDGTKLRQEIRYIPDVQAKKGNEYLSSVIINELIKGPTASSKLKSLLPKTTIVNSVKVNDNEVVVDISKSLFNPKPLSSQSPQASGSPQTTGANSANDAADLTNAADSTNAANSTNTTDLANAANTTSAGVSSIMMYSIIDSLTECEGITDVTFKVDGNADAQELKDLNIQGVQKRKDDIIDKSMNSK